MYVEKQGVTVGTDHHTQKGYETCEKMFQLLHFLFLIPTETKT